MKSSKIMRQTAAQAQASKNAWKASKGGSAGGGSKKKNQSDAEIKKILDAKLRKQRHANQTLLNSEIAAILDTSTYIIPRAPPNMEGWAAMKHVIW